MVGQQKQGPRKRDRGRLVPSQQERAYLVEQLLVGHLAAILVAGMQHHRQQIDARLTLGAALFDDLSYDVIQ